MSGVGLVGDNPASPKYSNGPYTWDQKITWTFSDSDGGLAMNHTNATENQKVISVASYPTDLTHGVRQGAIYISVDRTASYALTGWDGNPDCALKISSVNRAVSGSNGGSRAIDATARNRDSGTCSWINCVYLTAENSANTIAQSIVGEFHMKNNGVISTAHYGVLIQDDSQGTGPAAATFGLYIHTANYNPGGGRTAAIKINSQNTAGWTNGINFDGVITNVLDFEDADGTNGATYSAGHYTPGNCDGKIKIDIGGNTLYVPAYDSIA